jgi:UDPglucose--hexose-1-phosphate uridylyltransferase
MGELRRDPIIGQWVIVESDEKSLPPSGYEKEPQRRTQEAICQFCNGREAYTTQEVDAIRTSGSGANSPGWIARVIPNKFPALKIEGTLDKRGSGIYDLSNGIGAHEVLIETPDHNRDLADLTVEEIGNVIRLCQNRSLNLAQDKRFKYIMIFKNYGESAGASVEHAHSQIIALPMVPKTVLAEVEGSFSYYRYRGRCLYCDILQQEFEEKERIVTQNDSFVAFCPYVPRYPFEHWILPKEHNSDFLRLSDKDRYALASILKEMLCRMKTCLEDPSYNFYVHVPPLDYENRESFHWHIEVIPQLTREAGYEWGTGFYVVRTSPSMAADYLRKVAYP